MCHLHQDVVEYSAVTRQLLISLAALLLAGAAAYAAWTIAGNGAEAETRELRETIAHIEGERDRAVGPAMALRLYG